MYNFLHFFSCFINSVDPSKYRVFVVVQQSQPLNWHRHFLKIHLIKAYSSHKMRGPLWSLFRSIYFNLFTDYWYHNSKWSCQPLYKFQIMIFQNISFFSSLILINYISIIIMTWWSFLSCFLLYKYKGELLFCLPVVDKEDID